MQKNEYLAILTALSARFNEVNLSEQQLLEVEKALQVPLPADYREFVRDFGVCNFLKIVPSYPCEKYGYIENETLLMLYAPYNEGADIISRYLGFVHSDIDAVFWPGISKLREQGAPFVDGWPPELMPIGCDEGGNQICLAIFGPRVGSVWFWVNAPGPDEDNVFFAANSFDEFMKSLRPSEYGR